jgi:hypothetical protein
MWVDWKAVAWAGSKAGRKAEWTAASKAVQTDGLRVGSMVASKAWKRVANWVYWRAVDWADRWVG